MKLDNATNSVSLIVDIMFLMFSLVRTWMLLENVSNLMGVQMLSVWDYLVEAVPHVCFFVSLLFVSVPNRFLIWPNAIEQEAYKRQLKMVWATINGHQVGAPAESLDFGHNVVVRHDGFTPKLILS